MIIEHLSDHPDTISELAGWYVSEWRPYYGDTGPGDARVDLEARLSREALPVGIVAMEGDRVLATAALASLVQLRSTIWTGATRDTRPEADSRVRAIIVGKQAEAEVLGTGVLGSICVTTGRPPTQP